MSNRGLAIVIGLAAAGGLALAWLSRGPDLDMKVPGPCEIHQRVSYPGSDTPPPPMQRTVHRYDASGQLVLVQRMHDATHPDETIRHEYDSAGNHILEEKIRHGPIYVQHADNTKTRVSEQTSSIRWTYDDEGRMLTRLFERGEDDAPPPHETVYEYDERGHKIGAHAKWEGKYSAQTTYETDDEGRVLVEQHDGSRMGRKTFEYNERGQVIRETDEGTSAGELVVVREYDEAGLLLKETERLPLGDNMIEHREITWSYDDAGNPLERQVAIVASPDAGNPKTVETYDYSCWTIEDGTPVDKRGAP